MRLKAWALKRPLIRVGILVLAFILAIGSAEVFLRVSDVGNMRAGWRIAHELDSVHAKPLYVNQLGYRGHTISASEAEVSIVLDGDSQVECTSCPDDHLPEDALREAFAERGRKVRVTSLGASGFGADQELLALRSYFRAGYHADVVVVWQTPGNDIFNAMFPNMAPVFGVGKLKPTFRLTRQGELN